MTLRDRVISMKTVSPKAEWPVWDKVLALPLNADERSYLGACVKNARLREALALIATPKRPDGTYNRCREACEELARRALEETK